MLIFEDMKSIGRLLQVALIWTSNMARIALIIIFSIQLFIDIRAGFKSGLQPMGPHQVNILTKYVFIAKFVKTIIFILFLRLFKNLN